MSAVFDSLDYRSICSIAATNLKAKSPHWTLQKIAEGIPVHGPYLSNVFRRKAHFSVDQLFEFSRIVKLPNIETDYLMLLQDWERCASQNRRAELKKRIEKFRRDAMMTEKHLKTEVVSHASETEARYFLNPDLFLVSTFLDIERYAKNPSLIAKALLVPETQLKGWIDELIRMGFFTTAVKGEIQPGNHRRSFHLSKSSPFCDPHSALLSVRAQQHQRSLTPEQNYSFSLTFSATVEARNAIHSEFLKFLKSSEKIVKEAPTEDVFQMNFSLFPWSRALGLTTAAD